MTKHMHLRMIEFPVWGEMCPNLFRGLRFARVRAGSRGFARVCAGLRGFARVCAGSQIRAGLRGFARVCVGLRMFCGRRSTFARLGTDFVAGAALSQGQAQIPWQAQRVRKVRYGFTGGRSTFDKVRCRFLGRRSTFARSDTTCVAGTALSQGQVQKISWRA